MNPFLATDGYKTGHHLMYPDNTTLVYSNFTPRSNKYAPKGCNKVVSFGQQMVMKQIQEMFDKHFFSQSKEEVCNEIKIEYTMYLGSDYDVSHIETLHDLQYLPIKVKSLPEGTLVPMGVPVLTIYNTIPDFYWLTNFLETLISNLLWKPMTSATIAHQYKKNLLSWAEKTDKDNKAFVEFQGHDFSMRGMDSIDATISSGLGHTTSFLGSDSLPVIYGARKYYHETGGVIHSVNATEHSVMCAGGKEDEIETFRRLLKKFPTGILSVVSDTWDLWHVITNILPELKEEILARDGKLVIRPDSGDPVDIICGKQCSYRRFEGKSEEYLDDFLCEAENHEGEIFYAYGKYWQIGEVKAFVREYGDDNWMQSCSFKEMKSPRVGLLTQVEVIEDTPEMKGVIELLWENFGGTINEQGYRVLDSHIGAIYGDSITLDRAEQICKRLEAKGFASTNIVLGIGSFTYQYNTRDTFGFAMKATYVEVNGEGRQIFKDPVTDDGTKKSARGLLSVYSDPIENGEYFLVDQVSWKKEEEGELQTIFNNGKFYNQITLSEIRNKLNNK